MLAATIGKEHAMTTGIDPAIAAARAAAEAAKPAGVATIDPLQKGRDALLISDPANPHHAFYQQALQGLELLGPQRFKDRRELERVALAIALQAAAVGLARIDRVVASDDGAGYFFVDRHAVDPAMRGYVAHAEAVQPPGDRRAIEVQQLQAQRMQEQQRQVEQAQRDAQDARRAPPPPTRQF
jgi:hypothetical protein